MPDLVLHDQPIPTVFDLLGHDENDMTASLGWALAHNPALLDRFVERVAPGVSLTEPPAIELQKHDRTDGGFTDIELLAPELHVIVEAKIGWNPPSEAQLHRDEDPFAKTSAPAKRVVVLTQNGAERVVSPSSGRVGARAFDHPCGRRLVRSRVNGDAGRATGRRAGGAPRRVGALPTVSCAVRPEGAVT